MLFKICTKCGYKKTIEEFYYRKTGIRANKYYEKCKECMKARGVSYYRLNHERQLRLALIRRAVYRKSTKEFLNIIKNKPCLDCGKSFPPYVMDFDHKEGEKKEKEVARMVAGGWSLKNIQKEINKCDLVCANCHRIRTYKIYKPR